MSDEVIIGSGVPANHALVDISDRVAVAVPINDVRDMQPNQAHRAGGGAEDSGDQGVASTPNKEVVANTPRMTSAVIPISSIRTSRFHWDREISEIDELSASQSLCGPINPMLVRALGNEEYELLAGMRRLLGLQKNGANEARVTIVECDDLMAELLSLEENLKIKPPTSVEWQGGVRRLAELVALRKAKEAESITQNAGAGASDFSGPGPKKGKRGRPSDPVAQAKQETAKILNLDQSTVRRAIRREERLVQQAKVALARKEISVKQATRLASMSAEEQGQQLPLMIEERRRKPARGKATAGNAAEPADVTKLAAQAKQVSDRLAVALDRLAAAIAAHGDSGPETTADGGALLASLDKVVELTTSLRPLLGSTAKSEAEVPAAAKRETTPAEEIAALTLEQVGSLTPEAVAQMCPEHINALSDEQIRAFRLDQLQAFLQYPFFQSITAGQARAMTPDQARAVLAELGRADSVCQPRRLQPDVLSVVLGVAGAITQDGATGVIGVVP